MPVRHEANRIVLTELSKGMDAALVNDLLNYNILYCILFTHPVDGRASPSR